MHVMITTKTNKNEHLYVSIDWFMAKMEHEVGPAKLLKEKEKLLQYFLYC